MPNYDPDKIEEILLKKLQQIQPADSSPNPFTPKYSEENQAHENENPSQDNHDRRHILDNLAVSAFVLANVCMRVLAENDLIIPEEVNVLIEQLKEDLRNQFGFRIL